MGVNFMLNLDRRLIDDVYALLMISNDGLMADNLPQELNTIALSTPHTTLAQIALLSQFDEMMINQAPNSPLTHTPPLPILNKPALPSHLQRLAGQVLAHNQLVYVVRTLMMIDERGYSVPPTVWLPPKFMLSKLDGNQNYHEYFEGELPSDYLSWCAWVDGYHNQVVPDDEILTADNWEQWYPSNRLRLLKELRRTNPKFALDLIAQFAPKEPAEKRLDLVAVLAVGLSDDDKEFLESLLKDRSQKVKDEAKRLLARLGVHGEQDGLADELFDELEFGTSGIAFKSTKNNKQRETRYDNLQKVNLFDLAKKFNLSLKEFFLAWDFHHHTKHHVYGSYNQMLSERVIGLLSDDELEDIADDLIKIVFKENHLYYWGLVRARLPLSIRQEFAHKNFLKGKDFAYLIGISPNTFDMGFNALQATTSYKRLAHNIKQWQEKDGGYINTGSLGEQISALGLMVNQSTAKDCLNALYELGVDKTDPALQTLTLNALLEPLKSP